MRRVIELAPAYWKETLQKEEAQRLLRDHPLRNAVLSLDLHPDNK